MFLVVSTTSSFFFLLHRCLVHFRSFHWVATCCFLIVTKFCFCECFQRMRVSGVESVCTKEVFVVIYFLASIGWTLCYYFFLCLLEFPLVLLSLPTSFVCADVATFRLHISACNALMWSSCCLSCVVKSQFVIVKSVNARFINASSIYSFYIFFAPVSCCSRLCFSCPRSKHYN